MDFRHKIIPIILEIIFKCFRRHSEVCRVNRVAPGDRKKLFWIMPGDAMQLKRFLILSNATLHPPAATPACTRNTTQLVVD